MPYIRVRDLDVHYEIKGSGPRLLSISGTGGDLRRFPNIFDMSFSRDFETLGYDQRGLGRTSKPAGPYTMADYADDADALLSELGWESCHVIGISFGGMVAQEFALRYPHRVERLVLACTSSGGKGGASYPFHELSHLSKEDYIHRVLQLSDIRRDEAWRAANTEAYQMFFDMALKNFRIGMDEPGHEDGQRRQLEVRITHDTFERLPDLTMPVYICGGRYDGIAEPGNLEALHRQIPGSRFELFNGGHLFFLQDPDAGRQIGRFLLGEKIETMKIEESASTSDMV